MESFREQNEENIETSTSINKNLDIPILTKKKLNLRDLRCKNKDLSGKHADIKKILKQKENHFSFKEKIYNESREKLINEYQQAMKDNYDRQVILEEKIKSKEKKMKLYDAQIKKFKLTIGDLHERIKKATYDTLEREKCLSFLSKFKDNSTEFVQLDMFDRLETIFSSREFIKKKKEKLKAKINVIKDKIRDMEEKNNVALMNKETEYKNLEQTSENFMKKEKEIREKLKENINEHNKKALLLNVEKKNKTQDIMEDTQFIDTADFNNLEEDILKKLDLIYKYIKDTIYIINKAKKEILLKDDNQMEAMKNNLGNKGKIYSSPHENIEFFTYNGNVKGKNN
ncbi:conserved Plasmodium protein, unknown function [Plasmodium ovale]|uniref:Uncharacterized protein n=1 Tax=Plasmodium ovale TaxID=36330 RepID=A0A1C3KSG2_PLAOA|nr:conserved Plasmodium protein, unknown function [Plasmodium ovale]